MKKDLIIKISNIDMEFVRKNKDSKCPVVQAMIDKITDMGHEVEILSCGANQNNPAQDLNILIKNNKPKRIYKDNNGDLMRPVKKIESFGKKFIAFRYLNINALRLVRLDNVKKLLKRVSN